MKLIDHFDTFLSDVVDMNTGRLALLEDSVESLQTFIRGSNWGPRIRRFVPQGSWVHKTIIRPVKDKEFDADLLVLIDPMENWEAKKYVDELHRAFSEHGTYKDKAKKYSHCVTIEYAGERRIDIAPCVINRDSVIRKEVSNRSANAFELSEPENYTDWLVERNSWTGGNTLRKVTRLLKYLRDIKGTFACPSVLLTTMLGLRINLLDAENTTDFLDLPTALKTLTERLDVWLQANSAKPTVTNPILTSEVLSDSWPEESYLNFRNKINRYRTWIDDAYIEADRDESIGKWRRVFGDRFAESAAIEKAARISDAALVRARTDSMSTAAGDDLVTLFARLGTTALPSHFDRLPHKQRPWWREQRPSDFSVEVVATLHATRNGPRIGPVTQQNTPLRKKQWLEFRAVAQDGRTLVHDYDTFWRVTNTDREAGAASDLRGGIIKASAVYSHWESLSYRGVHAVEAFVVRKHDETLVAQSPPFYVTIA